MTFTRLQMGLPGPTFKVGSSWKERHGQMPEPGLSRLTQGFGIGSDGTLAPCGEKSSLPPGSKYGPCDLRPLLQIELSFLQWPCTCSTAEGFWNRRTRMHSVGFQLSRHLSDRAWPAQLRRRAGVCSVDRLSIHLTR